MPAQTLQSVVIAAFCCGLNAVSATAHTYTITAAATGFGSNDAVPTAINDSGVIAVAATTAREGLPDAATLSVSGVLVPLEGSASSLFTAAIDINATGDVVGYSAVAPMPGELRNDAYQWDATGTRTSIAPGSSFLPFTLSDAGLVGGEIDGAPALVMPGGAVVSLAASVGPSGTVIDINASGDVLGHAGSALTDLSPFLIRDGVPIDLGVDNGLASAVNNHGQAVGRARDLPQERAFIYDPATGIRFIDSPSEEVIVSPASINDAGVVVGVLINTGFQAGLSAFIYDEGRGLRPLIDEIPADSGWDALDTVFDINNHGQIVGRGRFMGSPMAFLATPIPAPSAGVSVTLALALVACNRLRVRG